MSSCRKLLAASSLVLLCAASVSALEPRTERNKALVARFAAAVNAKDFAAVRDLIAPNFVRHCQATPEVVVLNRDQFIGYLKGDAATFPDSKQVAQHLVAEGDLVAFWITYEATQTGQMGPFPPSGKRVLLDASGVFRVRDGQLAELWITWDNLSALTQLGYFPPPQPGQH